MQSERQWHYALAGQKAGPIPESELLRLRSVGVVNDQTLVWTDGWPAWRALGSVEELPKAIPSPTPLPPPVGGIPSTPSNNLATASVVCGAIGLFGMICCATGPVSIAAIVLGHMVLDKPDIDPKSRQLAKVGLIMGYVGLAFMIIPLIASLSLGGGWGHLPDLLRKFHRGVGI